MKDKLLKLIEDEDKKNPLTDQECARLLLVNRSEVTQNRQSLGIPDSRERRKPLLIKEITRIVEKIPQISERNLTGELEKIGFPISRFSVSKLLNEIGLAKDPEIKPDLPQSETFFKHNNIEDSVDPFSEIIGWNQSLRVKVEQAKAAVLYPPNGLHTLIVGATGVGKSQLAEAMHKYAIHTNKLNPREFPFIVFNCADYAENPQLLNAQLFGYKKGAFTGAETDRDGLVAKALGGMLFLDEVHRLPPDGQEILFQLIDKGTYRRLGDTSVVHNARVMIIAATSVELEKSLLGTFRRRIPMIIEIPPLSLRPVEERLEIIKMFFQKEAARINKNIVVNQHVIRSLLVYQCVGNIGQLRSDIQVACARGFLAYVAKGSEVDSITVDFEALPVHVTKGLLNTQWDRVDIEKLVSENLIVLPDALDVEEDDKSLYTFPNDFYKNIEEEYQKLLKHGLPDEVINRIIGDDLEAKVKKIIKQVEKNKHKMIKEDLKSIVRPVILELVQEMIKVSKNEMGDFEDTLFYCLATHLNAAVDRIKNGKRITNPQLEKVKEEYSREFRIATEMASLTSFYLGIDLPEEEIGFIAMYLKSLANKDVDPQDTVGIVVMTHGHVAEGMAGVANRLLGVDYVKAIEMSLDEKPELAYERALDAVMKADRGKGVLLLVDMGTLSGFGRIITNTTGIKTRTVTRVDTLMVVEALRKVLLHGVEIDCLADSMIKEKGNEFYAPEEILPKYPEEMAVISLCLTGEGMAQHLQNIVSNEVRKIDGKIETITMGILDEEDILEKIDKVNTTKNILAIVGTVNPRHPVIPFIAAVEVIKEDGLTKLAEVVRRRYNISKQNRNLFGLKEEPGDIFHPELIMLNMEAKDKVSAINTICALLVENGFVTGDFVHGVLEREELGSTALPNALAVPHGNSDYIIKPVVGIMTLRNPILWDDNNWVDLVFLMAIDENLKHVFQRLYKLIRKPGGADQIRLAGDKQAILSILNSL